MYTVEQVYKDGFNSRFTKAKALVAKDGDMNRVVKCGYGVIRKGHILEILPTKRAAQKAADWYNKREDEIYA